MNGLTLTLAQWLVFVGIVTIVALYWAEKEKSK